MGLPYLSVYDGRELIGSVIEHVAGCEAFDQHGNYIGAYRKRSAAVTAVHEQYSLRFPCVSDSSARKDGSP